MKKLLNYTGTKISLTLIFLGLIFLVTQSIFYGSKLDENNVIQDSIFLPLGMMLFILGLLVLLVTLIGVWLKH